MSQNRVRDYAVLEKLGQGSMGQVWLAEHVESGRHVALKILAPQFWRTKIPANRFRYEAAVQGRLKHPHIVGLIEFFEERGQLIMITEYVAGGSLDKVLKEKGILSQTEALGLMHGLLSGLAHAHGKGVIHRDVKPGNLMLTSERQLKISDFGLAVWINDSGGVTGAAGSPHYMSPEQINDCDTCDHRQDIYAAGVVLFEMLCGRTPFIGKTAGLVWNGHLHTEPPDPRSLNPALDPVLAQLILQAMAKNPADRFADCTAFRAAIAACERGSEGSSNG